MCEAFYDALILNRELSMMFCGYVRYFVIRHDTALTAPLKHLGWGAEGRRHESVVRRDDVASAAESVIGDLDSDYKRDEYVKQVIDDLLIQNPWDEQMVFFSPDEVVAYLESLDVGDHKAESDVYHLSEVLAREHANDVDTERINEIRQEFWFDPL